VSKRFDQLGIRLPIIQAPMAGVSSPAMAAAVTDAGGLGSISVGTIDADGAGAMIRDFRERSGGPLNVNLFCHRPAVTKPELEAAWIERLRPQFNRFNAEPPRVLREIYRSFVEDDAMMAILLEQRPPVVSFHFGLPRDEWIQALLDAGIVLLATATNLAEARIAADTGVQAIVAQGWEAGGHRGLFDIDAADEQLGTIALVRLLVRSINTPVIAAGGMMDGAGIRAALELGAAAAQLGTAFIACDESLADEGYRSALADADSRPTTMTQAISGRPARCLTNRFSALSMHISTNQIPDYPIAYDLGKALHMAAKGEREFGFGAQWAGQAAPLSRPMPAGRLVLTLESEL
jgi:nitronate monooxygenase